MKTTLPEKSKEQEDKILEITQSILSGFSDKIAFIILFGSFARGEGVYDTYVEDHITYEYSSDFDFLILTKKHSHGSGHAGYKLKKNIYRKIEKYREVKYQSHRPSVIVESVERMNKKLEDAHYFYSDIKREGILLYDSGEVFLSEIKTVSELSKEKRKQIATDYFDQWYQGGLSFLRHCKYAINDGENNKAAFMLYQSTENLCQCALLVLTGQKPKTHDLEELMSLCASQNNEFLTVFPRPDDKDLKKAFELLQEAYIGARYDKNYEISIKQLSYLIERVEILKDITEDVCGKYIASLS